MARLALVPIRQTRRLLPGRQLWRGCRARSPREHGPAQPSALTSLEAETRLRELAAELDLPIDELLRCYRDYAADIARVPADALRRFIRGFATFRDYYRDVIERMH